MIVHASIDENRNTKGGNAGDQTGKEVCIATFNPNRGWNAVLRPTKTRIAELMVKKGVKLANSNLVGYDQNQRNTLHDLMQKYDYNAAKYIKSGKKSGTDCSAFVSCLAIASGVKELEYTYNAPTTSNMVKKFTDTGKFKKLTYSKGMELKPGDVLVKEGSHTALYIGI